MTFKSQRILLCRSAPFDLLKQAYDNLLENGFNKSQVNFFLKEGETLDKIDKEKIINYYIPSVKMIFNMLNNNILNNLKDNFDVMVLPITQKKFDNYFEYIILAREIGVKRVLFFFNNKFYTINLNNNVKECIKFLYYLIFNFLFTNLWHFQNIKRKLLVSFFKKKKNKGNFLFFASKYYRPTEMIVLSFIELLKKNQDNPIYYCLGNADVQKDIYSLLGEKNIITLNNQKKNVTVISKILMFLSLKKISMIKKIYSPFFFNKIVNQRLFFLDKRIIEEDNNTLHYFSSLKDFSPTIIGMETYGLYQSVNYQRIINNTIDIYYWSMELDLKGTSLYLDFLLKKSLERYLGKYIKKTIIQDKFRGENIARNINTNFIYIPIASNNMLNKEKSDYAYKKFNIDKDKKIILYCGTLLRFHYLREIVLSAVTWPKNWVLILHFNGRSKDSLFLKELFEIASNKDNIIFSTKSIRFNHLTELISSVHIGLSLFNQVDENCRNIIMSSGKITQYLQNSIPVISNSNRGALFHTKDSGGIELIDSYKELKEKISLILKNYPYYREEAQKLYERKYKMDVYFKSFLNEDCMVKMN